MGSKKPPDAGNPEPPVASSTGEDPVGRKSKVPHESSVPTEYAEGRATFMGRAFLADPRALIPRAETELLARKAAALAREVGEGPFTVADIGTGSGNLAVTLAVELPDSRVFASDISQAALDLALANVSHYGLQDRVSLHAGSLFEAFAGLGLEGKVDVVICNPPYIPTRSLVKMAEEIRAHEPREAFDGGAFGMAVVRGLVDGVDVFLRPGGVLAFEIGAGQEALVARFLVKRPYLHDVRHHRDQNGVVRVLSARRV